MHSYFLNELLAYYDFSLRIIAFPDDIFVLTFRVSVTREFLFVFLPESPKFVIVMELLILLKLNLLGVLRQQFFVNSAECLK